LVGVAYHVWSPRENRQSIGLGLINMAIGQPFKRRSRRREESAIVQNVHVSAQKPTETFGVKFKPLVRLRIGASAPKTTRPLRTVELSARETRLLARELLARADEIDVSN
jgi:hypothetical protein